jgi:ClpP class serine protease
MGAKQRRGKPEKLPLPERAPEAPAAQPQEPFFIEIDRLRQQERRNVEAQLEVIRKERIRELQRLRGNSKLLVYYSFSLLDFADAQHFYEMLVSLGDVDNLDLFLLSPGGFSDPGFKIARLCQEVATGKFSVLIPYYAKSAATMLALGADELVMGPPSELGPIDPQIKLPSQNRQAPLHALRDALGYVEGRVVQTLDLMSLGDYDREIQSAKQYAENLLRRRMFKDNPKQAEEVARKLAEEYKRHNYVVDRREAREALKLNVIDAPSDVWKAMWQLHNLYDRLLRDTLTVAAPKVFETFTAMLRPGVSD